MNYAFDWVFARGWPGLFALFALGFIIGHLFNGHMRPNDPEQTRVDRSIQAKLRDTLIMAVFALAGWLAGPYLEVVNGTPERWALPGMLDLYKLFPLLLGNWAQLAVYAMGFHERAAGGFLSDAAKSTAVRIRSVFGWIRGRLMIDKKRLLVIAGFLFGALLACISVITPTAVESGGNWPLQTAGALNSTYEARATQTAGATATETPTATLTPDMPIIVTGAPIIEVGTPVNRPPAPGDFVIQQGTFTPYWAWNVRECPGCAVVGGLVAYHTYPIQGWVIEADGSTWLCQVAVRDLRGAEYCGPAMLYRTSGGEPSGIVVWGEQ